MTKWTLPDTPSPEALVRAALERAAICVEGFRGGISHPEDVAVSIRHIANDPAAVAQIIDAARQLEEAKKERG